MSECCSCNTERGEASFNLYIAEVARTVVAPPSSVVKCLWEVFVWGVVLVVCVCVGVGGVVLCWCVCDLLIFLYIASAPRGSPKGEQLDQCHAEVPSTRRIYRRGFRDLEFA